MNIKNSILPAERSGGAFHISGDALPLLASVSVAASFVLHPPRYYWCSRQNHRRPHSCYPRPIAVSSFTVSSSPLLAVLSSPVDQSTTAIHARCRCGILIFAPPPPQWHSYRYSPPEVAFSSLPAIFPFRFAVNATLSCNHVRIPGVGVIFSSD